jgi:ubiquinone/menaquinone biosynthesis C-methylase UbiE
MYGMTKLIGRLHYHSIFHRRLEALTSIIAPLLPSGPILDVGSGSGMIGKKLMAMRPDLQIVGIDVHLRPDPLIEIKAYDGKQIPYEDNTFSAVLLIDVLHHTDNFLPLLEECLRVSSDNVLIKDHFYSNSMEWAILSFLDWIGNKPYGVRLPYNYLMRNEWQKGLECVGAKEKQRLESIPGMYPFPFQKFLGQRIQFLSQIESTANNKKVKEHVN